jgi:hypothetical protein
VRVALVALLLTACAGESTVGPYVKSVARQGPWLIVQKCTIVLSGDELHEGECSMEQMPLGTIPIQQPPMVAPPGPPGAPAMQLPQAPPPRSR